MELLKISEYLDKKAALGNSFDSEAPNIIRDALIRKLKNSKIVCIDLSNLRSLSPSFAYAAFGKLVDEFGSDLEDKIQFTNDPNNLSSRISNALTRRKTILQL